MSRLLFPQDRTAYLYTGPGEPIRQPWMTGLTMYLDQACTTLADVTDAAGVALAGSQVFIGPNGLLPFFHGPVSGAARLWAKPPVDDPFPVDACYVAGQPQMLSVHLPGNAVAGSTVARYYNDSGSVWTVTLIRASAGIAPSGAPLVLQTLVDGVLVTTMTIPDGANTSGALLQAGLEINPGSYVTVGVTSVGSTAPGAEVTVGLSYVQTPVSP